MDDTKIARLNFLADIAEVLLVEGLTQQEAATRFNLSRPSISRLLAEARKNELIKIYIRRVFHDHRDLADRISNKFDIPHVHVGGVPRARGQESTNQYIRFAAEHVASLLEPGTTLGITLGKTLGLLVHRLATLDPQPISVVQLCGSIGAGNPLLDSHSLVAHLSQAYGATALHLHAPYAVESRELRDLLHKNPANRLCFEQAHNTDIALIGVGTTTTQQSSLYAGGHVDGKVIKSFADAGAVGDVAGFYIDSNGRPLDVVHSGSWRIGIGFDDFISIPRRIGIAVGSYKVPAMVAAMRGKLINELITDQDTAASILSDYAT